VVCLAIKWTVFFFTFEATPAPDSENAATDGGAYINCWVNFKQYDGAEVLARYYIEQTGWIPGEITESFIVSGDRYSDDPETLAFYREAEEDGICLSFYIWPRDAPDATDDPRHTSSRTFDA
jgi:hypothetical protein